MIIAGLILSVFYISLIGVYIIGWLKIPLHNRSEQAQSDIRYTILIPARNEEKVIEKCLSDIVYQQFAAHRFEIIVINDHSADSTAAVVQQFINNHIHINLRLVNMQDDPELRKQKKAAITFGIQHATGDYIVLTDADCERGKNWLTSIDSFVASNHAKMVYAPVAFTSTNVFEHIQAMEFAGLVGIGGAAIQLNNPNMCSAANLIFERQAFYDVDGYLGNHDVASGDDEYLLHKICKRYPGEVFFLKNREAIVFTSANASLNQLAEQRKRWVSKSTKYENRFITAILVGAYLYNASVLLAIIAEPKFGLLLLLAKMLVEGVFLYLVLDFFSRKRLLLLLPFAELFHIVYVLLIGILANTSGYRWKDRDISH